MTISEFIRDNTDDGRNIVRFLIDVMNGQIDGCRLTQRLTAARLLTIYGSQSAVAGQDDAPDFIADNTPDTSGPERGDKIWVSIDPGLTTLIKARTDDGRVICMFLIDVMEGRIEKANAGHRVSAAKELLNRAFGKSPGRSLPRASRSTAPRRSTQKKQWTPERARAQAPTATPAAPTAVLDEPEQQTEPEANDVVPVYRDSDDPLYLDEKLLQFYEACYDPDFDPYEATRNENYAQSYTGCPDPECDVHGNPPEIDFDPNDFHY